MDMRFEAADPSNLAGLMDEQILPNDVPLSEGPGTRIGRYKLLQLIGEGGFGSVFMAEQETPVVRRVALKIIKLGMDTKQVIARFEAERQALAMMDHPNIARVLDAGATKTGRPYFVMELVPGIPINQYCDRKRLTPRRRIELFLPVCRAIQHAHQKGIIHRDLKPSNILVMTCDGQPVPKVIDFGVAKAIHQRLTEKTLFTQFGNAIGTPEYMSPEQADMDVMGADTRSDIYSLGVLLYELLTGSTPFDRATLREAGYAQMLRMIREQEPPAPSTRLSQSGEALAAISSDRGTDPRELTRMTAGDLDLIVMKCLEKDRARRYETADALARDVQRYLNDEPVEASPPSATYRTLKLIRRHKREAVAVFAVVAVLFMGIIGTGMGLAQARHNLAAARDAEHRLQLENEAANAATVEARRAQASEAARRRQAEAATRVLESVFTHGLFAWENGLVSDAETVRICEQARDRIIQSVGADSVQVAQVTGELAQAYLQVGRTSDAIRLYQQERDALVKQLSPNDPAVLNAMSGLGMAYRNAGRYQDAIDLLEQALDAQTRSPVFGPTDRDTLHTLYVLASAYDTAGRASEASRLYEQVLAREQNGLKQELQVYQRARLYMRLGSFPQAMSELRELIHMPSPGSNSLQYAGAALAYLGAVDEYRECCRRMLDRFASRSPGTVFERTAKTCLLLPGGIGGDPNRTLSLVDAELAGANDSYHRAWLCYTRALALYRLREWRACLEWADKSAIAPDFQGRLAETYVLMAMAYHRVGEAEQARKAYARAEAETLKHFPIPSQGQLLGGDNENWLNYQVLRLEAEQLIHTGGPSTWPAASK